MVTKGKNYSGQTTPSIVDTEYVECNFAQPEPVNDGGTMKGVRLFPGDDTPRTFTHCTMTNCEPPPGSTCDRRCTIREKQKHVSSEYVTVDGEQIEVKAYANVIHGHYRNGEYVYLPEPHETPCEGPEDVEE